MTQTTNEPPLIPHLSVCQDAQPIQEATETETDDGPTTSSKPEPLPANWTLDDATRTALAEHHPNVDLDDQADRFRDYWTANPTRRSDWSAMFRNWVRTSIDRGLYRALTDHPATPATDDDAQWVDCYECHGSRWPDHPEWADDDGRCNAPGCINGRTERQPADQGAF